MRWILLILCFFILGCKDPKIDGAIARDHDGNVYLIKHHIFDLYTVDRIDMEALKIAMKDMKDMESE